jgi:hypothetical protein
LIAPQPRHAGRGPQFERVSLLPLRDGKGSSKRLLRGSQEELERINNGGGANAGSGAGQGIAGLAQIPADRARRGVRGGAQSRRPADLHRGDGILNGGIPGTGRNLQKLMPLATRIEPGFYQARQREENYYFGGGQGQAQLRSANTAIDQGVALAQAIKNLNNFSTLPGALNPVRGAIEGQLSGARASRASPRRTGRSV